MEPRKALSLKKELARTLVFQKEKRTVALTGKTNAASLKMATAVPSRVNGIGLVQKGDGDTLLKILARDKLPVTQDALARYYGLKREELMVETVGRIRFMSLKHRQRPPYPGASVGHHKITAGTLGCFVKDRKGVVYILSNNHVLANENNAFYNDDVWQPAPDDGGRRRDRIAGLARLVDLEKEKENEMDAAIAKLDKDLVVDYRITGMHQINGTAAAAHRMKVEKWGRTTGHTRGIITATDVDLQVEYGSEIFDFIDQFEVKGSVVKGKKTAFCRGGDSGSVIVQRGTHAAVGLLFSGAGNGTTFATPIDAVLRAFSVDIL